MIIEKQSNMVVNPKGVVYFFIFHLFEVLFKLKKPRRGAMIIEKQSNMVVNPKGVIYSFLISLPINNNHDEISYKENIFCSENSLFI